MLRKTILKETSMINNKKLKMCLHYAIDESTVRLKWMVRKTTSKQD